MNAAGLMPKPHCQPKNNIPLPEEKLQFERRSSVLIRNKGETKKYGLLLFLTESFYQQLFRLSTANETNKTAPPLRFE